MKSSFIVLGAVAILVGALSASARVSAAPASSSEIAAQSFLRLPPASPAGEEVLWGHIRSLARTGGRYEMRFDPAWLLHGVAAERAAFEDTGSTDVPNDFYVVEGGHRLLTFVVAAGAPVTILTRGTPDTTTIGVPELAQILRGKNPKQRPLFGRPSASGFWIRVGTKYPNPVRQLDQQYQP